MMSPQMQQALHLLQLPHLELSQLIEAELEQNPVLETAQEEPDLEMESLEEDSLETSEEEPALEKSLSIDERDLEILQHLDEDYRDFFNETERPMLPSRDEEKWKAYQESSLVSQVTLFEHLMRQAQETFAQRAELEMAEAIIGNLDDHGLLSSGLEEVAHLGGYKIEPLRRVLKQIQTFDPIGVGAETLQQALLIQLAYQGKQRSLAYQVVERHFQDLLHNHIPQIQKKLGCSVQEIAKAIRDDIARLDLHPAGSYSQEPVQPLTADVSLNLVGDKLEVHVNTDHLPDFHLNRKYMRMLEDENLSVEAKDFIKTKLLSAKWLIRNVFQRNDTLEKIAQSIAKRQHAFFKSPEGKLEPMTMKMVADELSVHESTVARAVSNKYIDCPRGLLPLRSFFTNAYATEQGPEISSQTVRDVLLELIRRENKAKPLSDEAIAKAIKQRGIDCARRTVAKYRAELAIGNTRQRRQF